MYAHTACVQHRRQDCEDQCYRRPQLDVKLLNLLVSRPTGRWRGAAAVAAAVVVAHQFDLQCVGTAKSHSLYDRATHGKGGTGEEPSVDSIT